MFSTLQYVCVCVCARQGYMAAVPPPPPPSETECYLMDLERAASLEDIVISMRDQLIMLVRWAKLMRCFRELDTSDQVAVIKAGSAKHLLLGSLRSASHRIAILLFSSSFFFCYYFCFFLILIVILPVRLELT